MNSVDKIKQLIIDNKVSIDKDFVKKIKHNYDNEIELINAIKEINSDVNFDYLIEYNEAENEYITIVAFGSKQSEISNINEVISNLNSLINMLEQSNVINVLKHTDGFYVDTTKQSINVTISY